MNPAIITLLLASSPLCAGLLSTLIFGRRPCGSVIPGLLFHSVVPSPNREMSQYPLDKFTKFLERVQSENYHTIRVRDAATAHTKENRSPLMLTFDDGLECLYHHVFPALAAQNMRATFFCLGGNFGKSTTWDIYSGNRHLTAEQIRFLSEKGCEIGSHTVSHPCLLYLDEASIRTELSESKKVLEDITGSEVTSLSFPYGAWNTRIWHIARETGYTHATLYRGKPGAQENLYPVKGVYRFDDPEDILAKVANKHMFSTVLARTNMMPHFAKGTPIWKYRKMYTRV